MIQACTGILASFPAPLTDGSARISSAYAGNKDIHSRLLKNDRFHKALQSERSCFLKYGSIKKRVI